MDAAGWGCVVNPLLSGLAVLAWFGLSLLVAWLFGAVVALANRKAGR